MKSFKHYLTESARTYQYTIKVAGEIEPKLLDLICINLKKFDPVKIEDPKVTPIQQSPYGFPDIKNESITLIKGEYKYPFTEPMVQQLFQLLKISPNRVRVVTTTYDDGINAESEGYKNQPESLLLEPNMGDNGKEAAKEYGNQYLDRVVPKKPTFDFAFSAKPTPIEKRQDQQMGTASPMSKIKLPPKPTTGSSR